MDRTAQSGRTAGGDIGQLPKRPGHNLKRGGDVPHVSLEEVAVVSADRAGNLAAPDDATNARKVQVTVMRDWSAAKAWRYRELTGGIDGR
jgi:hypothetical protein